METGVILLVTTKMENGKLLDISKERVEIANRMIAKHAPQYSMWFSKNLTKAHGKCFYREKRLVFNPIVFTEVSEPYFFQTLMHEIAHTQTPGEHHNFRFIFRLRALLREEGRDDIANWDDRHLHYTFDEIRITSDKEKLIIKRFGGEKDGKYKGYGSVKDYMFPNSKFFTYDQYEQMTFMAQNPVRMPSQPRGTHSSPAVLPNNETPTKRFACDHPGCNKDYANAGALYNHKKRKSHFKEVN